MNAVDAIVQAVLYEGYMLYPYRPSSIKNRQRWTLGGVCPQAYCAAHDTNETSVMRTECLVQGTAETALTLRAGFLHLVERQVCALDVPLNEWPTAVPPPYREVETLDVDGERYSTWQEAIERSVSPLALREVRIGTLTTASATTVFSFPPQRNVEPLRNHRGAVVGALSRAQQAIKGTVSLACEPVGDGVFRLKVEIVNATPMTSVAVTRNSAMASALVSCHLVLGVREGAFVSLTDPPPELEAVSNACCNVGTWPVLVGAEGSHDTMLSASIILYDYPQIAEESPGDLFDGTEIDEILTLRILTMTEEEKREMASADPRARALLERTERLTPEQLQALHGALRGMRVTGEDAMSGAPWRDRPTGPGMLDLDDSSISGGPWNDPPGRPRLEYWRQGGVDLRVGDQVRLCPRGNADIFDLALKGKLATIEAIERDFEDRVHVAVTVDDDPGRDLGLARMPGHRFFFAPEEVESVAPSARA